MTGQSSGTSRVSGMAVLHALYGLGVWAICFVVLYAGVSIGCGTSLPGHNIGPINGLTAVLVALWVLHVGVSACLVIRANRALRAGHSSRCFMQRLTLFLHSTAFVATVAAGLPVLLLVPCV